MLELKPMGGLHTTNIGEIRTNAINGMHQRGHDFYGTQCPDKCELADRWAAQRLIHPRALLTAARVDGTIATVAKRLGATPGIITAYVDSLSREDWIIMTSLIGHELT
jgi:hypothetical protein